jgi:hypothetical protein
MQIEWCPDVNYFLGFEECAIDQWSMVNDQWLKKARQEVQ